MKLVYPIIIKKDPEDGVYLVAVPDMHEYTQGRDFYDAIAMGRDIIGLSALDHEDRKADYPKPSSADEAFDIVEDDPDMDFDFSDGVLTYVDIDTSAYRNRIRNRTVKKNCTIPGWLNEKAEAQGINFSGVLKDALIEIVGAE